MKIIKSLYILLFVSPFSNSDPDHLFFKVSRSHTIRQTHTQKVGRTPLAGWSSRRRCPYVSSTGQTQDT